jgi:hypothetical protein
MQRKTWEYYWGHTKRDRQRERWAWRQEVNYQEGWPKKDKGQWRRNIMRQSTI